MIFFRSGQFVKFLELVRDVRGRPGHQASARPCLGECNDIPDGVCPAEEGYEAVETWRGINIIQTGKTTVSYDKALKLGENKQNFKKK